MSARSVLSTVPGQMFSKWFAIVLSPLPVIATILAALPVSLS